jgi:hypothetical protein
MKKIWVFVMGFVLGAPLQASTGTVKTDAAPQVEDSTQDTDKAAADAASSDADHWASKQKTPPKPNPPAAPAAAVVTPPLAPPPAPAVSAPSPATPQASPSTPPSSSVPPARVSHPNLNEMKGKLYSKSYDPKTLRLLVDGGFNVEFSYDVKTSVVSSGKTISLDDLEYNDELVIRYSGKDLYAVEIERTSKAPRPE